MLFTPLCVTHIDPIPSIKLALILRGKTRSQSKARPLHPDRARGRSKHSRARRSFCPSRALVTISTRRGQNGLERTKHFRMKLQCDNQNRTTIKAFHMLLSTLGSKGTTYCWKLGGFGHPQAALCRLDPQHCREEEPRWPSLRHHRTRNSMAALPSGTVWSLNVLDYQAISMIAAFAIGFRHGPYHRVR